MLSLVADPFASSLLARLRHGSTILLQDHVDPVVRNSTMEESKSQLDLGVNLRID